MPEGEVVAHKGHFHVHGNQNLRALDYMPEGEVAAHKGHFHVHGNQNLRALDYVELVLVVLGLLLHAVYCFFIVYRHVIHINLKMIYLFTSLTICVFLVSRLLDITMIVFDVHENSALHNWVHILHESSYTSIVSSFLLISLERLVATLWSDSYEGRTGRVKVVVAFVFVCLISLVIAYVIHIVESGFTILVVYVTICDTVTIVVRRIVRTPLNGSFNILFA
uniref:G_PROTEIN_RECEP_F1_2 domain-containing protein n=1 Tax=Steinernema glaseri TaxID=37863 RepID=A0A1I8A4D3_9BILA